MAILVGRDGIAVDRDRCGVLHLAFYGEQLVCDDGSVSDARDRELRSEDDIPHLKEGIDDDNAEEYAPERPRNLFSRIVSHELVEILRFLINRLLQDFTRLRAFTWANDTSFFEHIDEACCAGISHFELALEE